MVVIRSQIEEKKIVERSIEVDDFGSLEGMRDDM